MVQFWSDGSRHTIIAWAHGYDSSSVKKADDLKLPVHGAANEYTVNKQQHIYILKHSKT